MARIEIFTVAVITIVMAFSIQRAEALKCWNCLYDSRNPSTFCNDHFNSKNVSQQDKWMYQDCKEEPFHSVHCKKTVQIVNNSTLINRSCYNKPLNATKDQCVTNSPAIVTTEFCGLCEVDGCNGTRQLSSVAISVVTSMLIAIILSN